MLTVEIHIEGKIDKSWSEWFEGMEISHTETDKSVIFGKLKDQSALYGLVGKIRDLGLRLIFVMAGEIEDANNNVD